MGRLSAPCQLPRDESNDVPRINTIGKDVLIRIAEGDLTIVVAPILERVNEKFHLIEILVLTLLVKIEEHCEQVPVLINLHIIVVYLHAVFYNVDYNLEGWVAFTVGRLVEDLEESQIVISLSSALLLGLKLL
jgi:hypothetical protein